MTSDPPEEVILRYEMGFTPAEFHRLLPAVADVEFNPTTNEFLHMAGKKSWTLRLIDPRERRIATLRLPVIDVVFTFRGYSKGELDAVIDCFFTYFRRGGG